jgi:hypothetical protein
MRLLVLQNKTSANNAEHVHYRFTGCLADFSWRIFFSSKYVYMYVHLIFAGNVSADITLHRFNFRHVTFSPGRHIYIHICLFLTDSKYVYPQHIIFPRPPSPIPPPFTNLSLA